MDNIERKAEEVVYCIRAGEIAYALTVYPELLDGLAGTLGDEKLVQLSQLLNEMLGAQEKGNYVWLADLIQEFLIPVLTEE